MTFWQENYTFIKEVYDTRWAVWSWWCYLKQRANYWPLFVLRSHQETDGGFHVAPISKSVPIMAYFLTSKLTERSHHNYNHKLPKFPEFYRYYIYVFLRHYTEKFDIDKYPYAFTFLLLRARS